MRRRRMSAGLILGVAITLCIPASFATPALAASSVVTGAVTSLGSGAIQIVAADGTYYDLNLESGAALTLDGQPTSIQELDDILQTNGNQSDESATAELDASGNVASLAVTFAGQPGISVSPGFASISGDLASLGTGSLQITSSGGSYYDLSFAGKVPLTLDGQQTSIQELQDLLQTNGDQSDESATAQLNAAGDVTALAVTFAGQPGITVSPGFAAISGDLASLGTGSLQIVASDGSTYDLSFAGRVPLTLDGQPTSIQELNDLLQTNGDQSDESATARLNAAGDVAALAVTFAGQPGITASPGFAAIFGALSSLGTGSMQIVASDGSTYDLSFAPRVALTLGGHRTTIQELEDILQTNGNQSDESANAQLNAAGDVTALAVTVTGQPGVSAGAGPATITGVILSIGSGSVQILASDGSTYDLGFAPSLRVTLDGKPSTTAELGGLLLTRGDTSDESATAALNAAGSVVRLQARIASGQGLSASSRGIVAVGQVESLYSGGTGACGLSLTLRGSGGFMDLSCTQDVLVSLNGLPSSVTQVAQLYPYYQHGTTAAVLLGRTGAVVYLDFRMSRLTKLRYERTASDNHAIGSVLGAAALVGIAAASSARVLRVGSLVRVVDTPGLWVREAPSLGARGIAVNWQGDQLRVLRGPVVETLPDGTRVPWYLVEGSKGRGWSSGYYLAEEGADVTLADTALADVALVDGLGAGDAAGAALFEDSAPLDLFDLLFLFFP